MNKKTPSNATPAPRTLPQAPLAFHLLAKPTGATCNLDCKYCFFLSKEMLYPGSRFRMANDLLETYIRQLLEAHSQVPEVNISWQGGEPTLMGLDFFELSIKFAEKYKKPGQNLMYTIQTNGTKIDDSWAAFFKKHNFLVGLSMDGPKELHDIYRVNKGGQGTFDQVIQGLADVEQAWRGCQYPMHCPCRQWRSSPGDLPLLPRRAQGAVYAIHPDH